MLAEPDSGFFKGEGRGTCRQCLSWFLGVCRKAQDNGGTHPFTTLYLQRPLHGLNQGSRQVQTQTHPRRLLDQWMIQAAKGAKEQGTLAFRYPDALIPDGNTDLGS